MRGEKQKGLICLLLNLGSPPHARGKDPHHDPTALAAGITPACAGKRVLPCSDVEAETDHPRMRGEKSPQVYPISRPQGSPPHARGKGWCTSFPPPMDRITPACAGKSVQGFSFFLRGKDHPRMRGEKPLRCFKRSARRGSPPHARGKVPQGVWKVGEDRITPACAGKSYQSCCSCR